MATQSPWLLRFPPELSSSIVSFLPNRDVKSLRLTCKALSDISPFSSARVFLSASSLNIEVFRAVADHPKFRHEIREIIWDDARFVSAPLIWESVRPIIEPERMEINSNEECPIWFTEDCAENRYTIKHRKYRDVDRPDHVARQHQLDAQMPLKACWKYYQQLLDDQRSVIRSEDDEKAFLYGLERFPQLERVTVTPAAHGWLFTPLYETPMIRQFPYGFNYPIPRGWHYDPVDCQVAEPLPWSEATDDYKELWRGARIVLRLLSQVEKHNVSELRFDSKQLHTGLNFLIFDQPCDECNQFAAIMKRPGFQRLHLSLLTGSSGYWTGFQSGLFRQAVSLAKELTHLHLSTTFNNGSDFPMRDPPIPLNEVLPLKEWPNLSHLGLSNFSVDTSELIDILKLAPSSLRYLDLEFIEFPFDALCLTGLLERMREDLVWTKRDQSLKPTVTIAMEGQRRWPGRFVKLSSDEVATFLYGSGENPLDGDSTSSPKSGYGINYDLFEAEYTRPNVNFMDLKKLGIIC
ncbi:unnamed protein product [Penicillium salamii]|uniref:F-box domain-containing protein n=1 Tax=Penicillium salamii TaxID=1612424 RepID=A0A9W4NV20_9EURO|nr:unnamed protein product [Penicillium salamii]CAG8181782.1 unnamed protein product [Penicillium salamii]CAG8213997.1 unnamed protein product [Penicillium salamii]CAG8248298.1 unnamed protein product [Penicillium salamii]CAG8270338.1 unnamed protein product [Penicillium salamii]